MSTFRVSIFVICCLLLNGILPSISASQHVKALNANFQQDSMAICSGSGITWYSESSFLETGLLVEVAPPVEKNNGGHSDQHATACLLSLVADLPQNNVSYASPFIESYLPLNIRVDVSYDEYTSAVPLFSKTPRAPPYKA